MSYPVYYVESGDTLPIMFSTFDGGTGASITMTGLAVTDIEIYKDGSATQRASDSGYTLLDTDGIDFDGITGIHGFSIDLSDNTDAGFYAVGSWYHVVVSAITVDSQTVSFVAAAFRILSATRGMAGTALPDAAADAAGGIPVSDAGGLDLDTQLGKLVGTIATGTHNPQSGDAYARLGAPAGASVSADVAAVKVDTAAILDDTGTSGVVVASASKTGYTLTPTTGLGNQTANITGNLSGSVGSVTGNVGGNVTGSVGSISGVTFPTNFGDLAITVTTGKVTVGTNDDKTGYSLTAVTGLGNQTADITGNLSGSVGSVTGAVGSVTGAVGSVTGNVGGNVTGSVGSVLGGINTAAGTIQTLDALDTAQDSQHATTQAAIADVPTVAEFEARTLAAAAYFDPATDGVTLANGVAHGGSTATLELGSATSTAAFAISNTGAGSAMKLESLSKPALWSRSVTGAGIYFEGASAIDARSISATLPAMRLRNTVNGPGVTIETDGVLIDAAGAITADLIATDAIDADALAADAVAEIADAVWDEVITGAEHNVNTSAAKFLREASSTITGETGTAQAGGTSTITLAAGASATDQLYQWERIAIIDGTGTGQAKLIVNYNGTTKVATVNSAWAVQPDNTSVYAITGADVVVDAIDNQTVSATAAVDFDDLTTLATDWADGGRLDLILDGVSTLDAAGVRTAVGLAAANLDTQLAALQTDLDTVTDTGVTCVALTSAAVEDAFSTYTIAEAYHADGAAGTPAQLLYFTMQALTEFAISGTTVTVKKLDGSTTAGTFTLDDATTPTSRTRAT